MVLSGWTSYLKLAVKVVATMLPGFPKLYPRHHITNLAAAAACMSIVLQDIFYIFPSTCFKIYLSPICFAFYLSLKLSSSTSIFFLYLSVFPLLCTIFLLHHTSYIFVLTCWQCYYVICKWIFCLLCFSLVFFCVCVLPFCIQYSVPHFVWHACVFESFIRVWLINC